MSRDSASVIDEREVAPVYFNSLSGRINRLEEPLSEVFASAQSAQEQVALLLDRRAGIEVLTELIKIEPTSLPRAGRVDYLRALEKQASWLQAVTQDAIVALAGLEASEAADRFSGVDETEREDVSTALRLSATTAQGRIDTARSLKQELKNTAAALAAGEISSQHATVIAKESGEAIRRGLAPEKLREIENSALSYCEYHTPAQVGYRIRHMIAKMSPEEFELAAVDARENRRVVLLPELDGMATISAYLAAPDAHIVMMAVDEIAKSARINLPGERIDPLRADALLYLAKEYLRNGFGKGENSQNSVDQSAKAEAPSMASDSALDSALAQENRVATGVIDIEGLEEREPMKFLSQQGREDRHHRRLVTLNLTMDLDAFLGLSDSPGILEGYGAIPSSLARELSTDAKWRRFITQPITGELLDIGRENYHPPQALIDFIRARDRVCRFPGCRQPGSRADIDHAKSWESGGETSRANLGLLCRRHHRMKTHEGWELTSFPDGSCEWRSPEGRKYFVPARPINQMV